MQEETRNGLNPKISAVSTVYLDFVFSQAILKDSQGGTQAATSKAQQMSLKTSLNRLWEYSDRFIPVFHHFAHGSLVSGCVVNEREWMNFVVTEDAKKKKKVINKEQKCRQ